jgi:hypothetical protein
MLENIGPLQNGQSRETDNIGYTRQRNTKQKRNTICVGHHYTLKTKSENENVHKNTHNIRFSSIIHVS